MEVFKTCEALFASSINELLGVIIISKDVHQSAESKYSNGNSRAHSNVTLCLTMLPLFYKTPNLFQSLSAHSSLICSSRMHVECCIML